MNVALVADSQDDGESKKIVADALSVRLCVSTQVCCYWYATFKFMACSSSV
jgi:hypothetical protein